MHNSSLSTGSRDTIKKAVPWEGTFFSELTIPGQISGKRLLHEWSLLFKNVEEICISFSAIPNVLFHKQLSRNGVNFPRQMGQNLPKFSKNGKFRLYSCSRNVACPVTMVFVTNVKLAPYALFS